MSASHHPSDELLLSYAAGSLDEPTSILIATHLALCPDCRKAVVQAEQVGGDMINELEPAEISSDAMAAVMSELDVESSIEVAQFAGAPPLEEADNPLQLPSPLRDYLAGGVKALKWRWLAPGLRYAGITLNSKGPKVGLLRIAPGTRVPEHGHSGEELTLVLAGGYSDAAGAFVRGDVECADGDMIHQPVADQDEECVCLIVTSGQMQPTGVLAKLIQPFIPI